jgi:hypothetical protein
MRNWKNFTLGVLAALAMTVGITASVLRGQDQPQPKGRTRPPASPSPAQSPTPTCVDQDHDGYGVGSQCVGARDCNDTNPQIHPGAIEVCDKLDNDCNGVIDDRTPACPK